jgi:uncharacterized protein
MTEIKDTLNITREPPKPRTYSQPYWDATRERKLLIQYDKKSGKHQFYPRPNSIYTGRLDGLEWREVSGKGKVFTFTIARRTRPPFQGHEPFFICIVTLEEGVNVMGNVVNCSLEEMKIGLPMKPYWQPLANGTHLLMFQPDK